MDTNKDVLTFESIKVRLDDIHVNDTEGELTIPIGLDEKGELYSVKLNNENCRQHIAIFGVAGSGKSNAVNVALAAVQNLYGADIKIHYLNGGGQDIGQWLGRVLTQGTFRVVHTCNDLVSKMDKITTEICKEGRRSLVVLDDICSCIPEMSKDSYVEFDRMVEIIPRYNAHILLAEQQLLTSPTSTRVRDWSAIGLTRVSAEVAKYYHNSTLAATATDKYGDMVMQHRNSHAFLKIPYISDRDINCRLFLRKTE